MKRLSAKYLYTLTSAEPLRNGFVEVEEDGTVVRTGVCAEGEEVMDGAIVPGFVNAHCHVELSYMKGLFRKGTGMAGFIDQINALRDSTSREERIKALKAAMDGMWEQGVVAMADISNGPDSFAVKAEHPLYTRTFLEVFGAEPAACPEVMEGVKQLQQKALAYGLDAAPTPHACYTMSPELLTAASVAGLESGFLSYHSEESEEEEEMMLRGSGPMWDNRVANGIPTPPVTGTSSLEYFLDRLQGALPLPVAGHVLLVHECCLTPEGAAAARRVLREPYLAVCPLSNLFIHHTLPPIPVMRESGIPICVGTDSLSSNDELCLVAELACLQAAFPEVSLGELLEWACLNGARFLGKDAVLGTIEAGKKPGLVLISGLEEAPAGSSVILSAAKNLQPRLTPAGSSVILSAAKNLQPRLTPASKSIRL